VCVCVCVCACTRAPYEVAAEVKVYVVRRIQYSAGVRV
jgi:hypothetical protein